MAQDELSSFCFERPRSAIESGAVDFVLPLRMIAAALVSLALMPGATDVFRVPGRLPEPSISVENAVFP
jgi:hypothetical protein